jgi:hypothetical protein
VLARVALTLQAPAISGVTTPVAVFTEQIVGVLVAKLTAPVPLPPLMAPLAGRVAVTVFGKVTFAASPMSSAL